MPLLKQGREPDRPRRGVFAVQAPDGHAGMEFTTGDLDPEAELTTLDVQRAVASGRPAVLPATSVPLWSTTSRAALPGPRRQKLLT